jgi:histidine triad (HIT) family protein
VFQHAPPAYVCPFCAVVGGHDNPPPHTQQSDVVWRTAEITAFINARWWPNNPGHVLVVPNQHVESLYDLVPSIAVHVHEGVRQVALALKHVYRCDGTSTRQHNEPAGHQEVWHYHVHVFPRYEGDDLYPLHYQGRYTEPGERVPYAERLRAYFAARGA